MLRLAAGRVVQLVGLCDMRNSVPASVCRISRILERPVSLTCHQQQRDGGLVLHVSHLLGKHDRQREDSLVGSDAPCRRRAAAAWEAGGPARLHCVPSGAYARRLCGRQKGGRARRAVGSSKGCGLRGSTSSRLQRRCQETAALKDDRK